MRFIDVVTIRIIMAPYYKMRNSLLVMELVSLLFLKCSHLSLY